MSPPITGLEILGDENLGEGGFLTIRRLRLQNRRADGSLSRPYLCDFVARARGTDAVVVVVFTQAGGPPRVLLRDSLRPAITLGRSADRVPIPDGRAPLFIKEVVGGIIEEEDRGLPGVRARALLEVREETGYEVDPLHLVPLGAPLFNSPGVLAERFFFFAAEVQDPASGGHPEGDGSPMEEGTVLEWMPLDEAIAASVRGALEDVKTELSLRRLRDHLGGA